MIVKRNFRIWNKLDICALTREGCVDAIFDLTEKETSSIVDLLGIPMAVKAMENREFEQMYNSATMTIIDGMPVVKMCRRAGITCDRCSGPDIMPEIFRRGVEQNKTHYFYGGMNNEVLLKLQKELKEKYDGVQILGMYAPPFRELTESEDKTLCDEINRLKPDFIWVGIGAPKQEIWMRNHKDKINQGVMIGVGAAFNFFSGTIDKAPDWIENMGLEWLYRLIKEPKRLWKRYIIGGVKFIYYSIVCHNYRI